MGRQQLDFAEIRKRLAQTQGKEYWRCLEELAGDQEFLELLRREFPSSALSDAISRREFLTLMGASLALAGLNGCGRPAPTDEKIVPYVRQPEELVLGKPKFFATAFTHNGSASGLLVESHEVAVVPAQDGAQECRQLVERVDRAGR